MTASVPALIEPSTTLALALSLPPSMPRELLVGIIYVVVLSVLGQGPTIGPPATRLQRRPKPD